MRRTAQIIVIAGFLGAVYGVPVTQAILDLLDDELPQCLELFDAAPTEEHLREFENDLEENSWFEETIRPIYMEARYRLTGDLGEKSLAGRDGWAFYHPGVKYLYQPYFREIDGATSEGDPVETIVDLRDQLKQKDIALLMVIVPGKATVYPDLLSPDARRVAANTRRFIGELQQHGVEVLALHDLFLPHRAEADRRKQSLYMATDTHWSGEGVILAAARIASRVREESWYVAPGAPRYERKAVTLERDGDVLRMTQIPYEFARESVVAHQVSELESGELYGDDDKAPLLWLGDSFSRIFQTDAPRSAGVIANLAYELQTPLASIVNDGGASTLVRQQLARRVDLLEDKKLVIWEFIERDARFGMRGWQKIRLWDDDGEF